VVRGEPSEIMVGPILQKEAPGFLGAATLHTVNAFLTREVGHNRGDRTGLFVAAQSRLRLHPLFKPGVELYHNVNDAGRPGGLRIRRCLPGRCMQQPRCRGFRFRPR
ncbi:MAG: hypothetical protein QOH17_4991, partial [Pseudonocardiales bacterium]|nr:hypothetical protein [Pseudonocardiales bacterium]